MPTCPQNAGNPISENLNFKYFQGDGERPRLPLRGTACGTPLLEPTSLKSCIHPRPFIRLSQLPSLVNSNFLSLLDITVSTSFATHLP